MRIAACCSHRPDRPVRGVRRCRAQRAFNDGSDLIIIDRPWSTRAGLIKKTLKAILQKATTPFSTAQRKRIALPTKRSRSAGRAGVTNSVVRAGTRHLDVGAEQEGALGALLIDRFKAERTSETFRG